MRCHVQALTIKLGFAYTHRQRHRIAQQGPRIGPRVISAQAGSAGYLTPVALAGSLNVPKGCLLKMKLGPGFIVAFAVGR